jgi:WD40 repeat protein
MDKQLDILAVIGFKGTTLDGLVLHPDNEHLIFPLGNQIVVRNVLTREQKYLRGHDNDISVISISNNGKYLATGQKTHSGFKADIIIWDFETGTLIHRLSIHKVAIQALSFSYNDNYLVSLGGIEDNYLIIWDVQSGKALCGNTAGTDQVQSVKFFNTKDDQIVTCQNYGIKIWKIDYNAKKLISTDVNFGNLRRIYTCICLDPNDKFGFFGTKTGDIVEVDLINAIYKRIGPVKRLFSQGINTISSLPNGDLLVGTGEGVVAKIGYFELKIKA